MHKEKFKDPEIVIKSRKSKDRQYNGQKENDNKIQTVDKILYRKLNTEQHEQH